MFLLFAWRGLGVAEDATSTGLAVFYGREVVSLSYTTDGPAVSAPFLGLIEIKVGKSLTEDETAFTIRNLFGTRRFADVQIEGISQDGGVAVVVHFFRSYRLRRILFTGKVPISRENLRRALSFSEGAVFVQEDTDEGGETLRRRLQQEGYLQARVTPGVVLDPATFDATLTYRIDPGPHSRAATPIFDGDTAPFSPEQLLQRSKLKIGKPYSEAKARSSAGRMADWLYKNSYLRASVELIAAQPTPDGNVAPVYRISVGKKIVFDTVGVKASTVRSEIRSLIEGQTFDEDLILQYVSDKREALQGKGYYRAHVDYKISEEPATTTVTITVDAGPHFEIEKIVFSGNASVTEKALQELMVTHSRGLPFISPGHLVDEELDGDVAAIRGYYQTRGWIGVKVDKPRVTEGSKPDRLIVAIPIEEGPRSILASSSIVGATHVDIDGLLKRVVLKVGEPLNPAQAQQDAYNLTSYFHDNGWREASVKPEITFSADRTAADVVYQVEEGMRSFFAKTIIRGNSRTDTAKILQLATWKEGEPFSETKVVETQRNLARAGVFRRVEVRPDATDPGTQSRNVNIDIREGRPLSLLYGVGYQYAPDATQDQSDPYLVGGISYNNLFGKMLSTGLEGQLALSGRYRLQLSFRDPFLFERDYPFTSYLYATREPIQSIEIQRFGWANEVSHYFTPRLRVAMRLEYQRIRPVNPEDLSSIELADFPLADQPIEEATIGPNVFYDRRDDPLDPHRGYYLAGAFKYAFPVFGAQARYSKTYSQAAFFLPLGKSVIATQLRGGAIFPYGPSDIQVPINERFFGGKNSTNRGFDSNLLGIPGETVDYDTKATAHSPSGEPGSCATSYPNNPVVANLDCSAGPRPIGGNGMFAFNIEFRFPIAGPVYAAAFYDVAQVWMNFSEVNFHFEGANGLRQAAGLGIRVMTPIGPLRADYGMPLVRRTITFDVTANDENGHRIVLIPNAGTVKEGGQFFFSIGYPF
jgi:outer membrane protein insertion porin family